MTKITKIMGGRCGGQIDCSTNKRNYIYHGTKETFKGQHCQDARIKHQACRSSQFIPEMQANITASC